MGLGILDRLITKDIQLDFTGFREEEYEFIDNKVRQIMPYYHCYTVLI